MKLHIVYNPNGDALYDTLSAVSAERSIAAAVNKVNAVIPGMTWVDLHKMGFVVRTYIEESEQ